MKTSIVAGSLDSQLSHILTATTVFVGFGGRETYLSLCVSVLNDVQSAGESYLIQLGHQTKWRRVQPKSCSTVKQKKLLNCLTAKYKNCLTVQQKTVKLLSLYCKTVELSYCQAKTVKLLNCYAPTIKLLSPKFVKSSSPRYKTVKSSCPTVELLNCQAPTVEPVLVTAYNWGLRV